MTPSPLCTNTDGAMTYLACSRDRFDRLRRTGIVKALGKDWYSYEDLNAAVAKIRQERDKTLEHEISNRAPSKGKKPVASKGNQSGDTPTEELLRIIEGNRRTSGR